MNRRVASTLTFDIDLVNSVLARQLSSLAGAGRLPAQNPVYYPHIHTNLKTPMAETHLPTPAASSSTSPAKLDSTGKKRPRDSTASSVNKTPATKKAKAEDPTGSASTKEAKGVFCHQ
jgi:hypothetical protein